MKCPVDTETVKSTRCRAEMDSVKAEMAVLLDENCSLRGSLRVLEARVDSSFANGYFTTSYEVATALPPTFDLQTALNLDRDQIMAKAAQFFDADLS